MTPAAGLAEPRRLTTPTVTVVSIAVALAVVAVVGPRPQLGLAALALLFSVGVVTVTAWRPIVGCGLLVVAVPLTAGLGRDTIIPVLRVSEALTALIVVGFVLHQLPRPGRRTYSLLDLAVLVFTACGVLIPFFVLLIEGGNLDLMAFRNILAPVQFALIYVVFSRTNYSDKGLSTIFKLSLAISAVLDLIGALQLAGVQQVRDFVEAYYMRPDPNAAVCQFGICRPTSLLEHWSSFGAYAVMNYTLALALLSCRTPGFSTRSLAPLLVLNALGALVSLTQSAIIGLLLGTVVVLLTARRLPRVFLLSVVAVGAAAALFLPALNARLEQQFDSRSSGDATPQSLQVRERYWSELFVPAVQEHIWFGTGTEIPPIVPDRLTKYVDNEYLRMAFRAGAVGVAALVLLLSVLAASGWAGRRVRSPLWRAISIVGLAYALEFALMGVSAEYTTYAGVGQPLWIAIGIVGAGRLMSAGGTPQPAA